MTYERVRETEESGASRTARFHQIVQDAREEGRIGRHTAQQVATLFESGSDGERIAALGMMQGDHALADVDAIVDAISHSHSHSAFEQWQALFLAHEVWDSLSQHARDRIVTVIERQMRPDGYIQPGRAAIRWRATFSRARDQQAVAERSKCRAAAARTAACGRPQPAPAASEASRR